MLKQIEGPAALYHMSRLIRDRLGKRYILQVLRALHSQSANDKRYGAYLKRSSYPSCPCSFTTVVSRYTQVCEGFGACQASLGIDTARLVTMCSGAVLGGHCSVILAHCGLVIIKLSIKLVVDVAWGSPVAVMQTNMPARWNKQIICLRAAGSGLLSKQCVMKAHRVAEARRRCGCLELQAVE
jgi:hypothetical protein